ncbi:MAG: hypothetical protein RL149_577 [Actinomycetota bacterium]|jgi:phosphinothricin acetyltransferase
MLDYSFVDCDLETHGTQILEILNEAIANSTALYDYQPRPIESMTTWFANKAAGNFPVVGAIAADGTLLGFATFGTFRAFPAYKYTVEHSIYIHRDARGHGLGKLLLGRIIEEAQARDLHAIVGAIDASNQASMALHEKFGFKHVGTLPQVGFKFDKWLDLAFFELILDTPANPVGE